MSQTEFAKTQGALPSFGAMAGVRIAYSAAAVAGPFAANLMGEQGAEVIWIENAKSPEAMRTNSAWFMEADRRNQRTVSIDLAHEDGRAIFLKLLATVDIFIEASKGGQYARLGLTDEVMWEANPRLVIVHISGFGQTGIPEYVSRPSYDPIAQAFGGMLQLNGDPDRPPMPAQPYCADHFTGLFACCGALMALHRARTTGQGESVDVAQFETLIRVGGSPMMNYLNTGKTPIRDGQRNVNFAGVGAYACGDGNYVYVTVFGLGVLKPGLMAIGCDPDAEMFQVPAGAIRQGTPAAEALDSALEAFCMARSALEVADLLTRAGVPASAVYTYEMAEQDPHYQTRQTFIDWHCDDGTPARGSAVVPRMKRNPGRIWRGAPSRGKDNEAILQDLGFTAEQIEALYASGVIAADTAA